MHAASALSTAVSDMQAISGIANSVPKELGASFPFLVCALQAHSKVVFRAIEGDAPLDVINALFSQCKMLQVRIPPAV